MLQALQAGILILCIQSFRKVFVECGSLAPAFSTADAVPLPRFVTPELEPHRRRCFGSLHKDSRDEG